MSIHYKNEVEKQFNECNKFLITIELVGGRYYFHFIFSLKCLKRKPLRHLVNYGKSDRLSINSLNVGVFDEGGNSYS